MANIVLCCDGTANEIARDITNVAKLFSTLVNEDNTQLVYYLPSLGTVEPGGTIGVTHKIRRLLGLVHGYGLEGEITNAYSFLASNYIEGDHIFLFGFSRGAYIVYAVTSFLHSLGLTPAGNGPLAAYAIRMATAFRKSKTRSGEANFYDHFKTTFSTRYCKPRFIGVWDTPGSVGWFGNSLKLPSFIEYPDFEIGRHAIALDERRAFFRANLWMGSASSLQARSQDIKQVWFSGAHSDVGGGYPEPESALSKISLQWMLEEACAAGLLVDRRKMALVLGESGGRYVRPDSHGVIHHSLRGLWRVAEFIPKKYYDRSMKRWHWRINLFRRRTIPPGSLIHQSVYERADYEVSPLPLDTLIVSNYSHLAQGNVALAIQPQPAPHSEPRDAVGQGLSGMTGSFVDLTCLGNMYEAGADIFSQYAGSEDIAAPLAACVFWQIAMRSPAFSRGLSSLGVRPWQHNSIESFVVTRGQFDNGRYDLAVFVPGRRRQPAAINILPLSDADLRAGMDRWLSDRGESDIGTVVVSSGLQHWRSIRDNVPFGLIVMQRPKMVRVAALSALAAVNLAPDGPLIASAGLLAQDSDGRVGVTTARHAVCKALDLPPTGSRSVVVGAELLIGDTAGEVVAEDVISDSVFVVLTQAPEGIWPSGHSGWLQKTAPRQREKASFSGATTAYGIASIDSMSPEIPYVSPLSQLKVITDPVTSPGDSGAALIDSDKKIVGFAFERTAPGEPGGFSSWIWADSVMHALRLRSR